MIWLHLMLMFLLILMLMLMLMLMMVLVMVLDYLDDSLDLCIEARRCLQQTPNCETRVFPMLEKEGLFIFKSQCQPSGAQTEASNQVGDQLGTEDISFSARLKAPAPSISVKMISYQTSCFGLGNYLHKKYLCKLVQYVWLNILCDEESKNNLENYLKNTRFPVFFVISTLMK